MNYEENDVFEEQPVKLEPFRTPEVYKDYMQIMKDLDDEMPPCANYPDAYYMELKEENYRSNINGAKEMCETCPALLACRVYGLKWEEFGIWGGLTSYERIQIRGRISVKRKLAN